MLKIKFECWWTDSDSINRRIIKQFVKSSDLNDYSLVTHNPDFTIVLGRTDWNNIQTSKNKTFYISQEPLWSPNEPKDNIHEYCSKIIIADKSAYPNREEYIEKLLPMLYAGRGESDTRLEWDWSYDLCHKDYIKTKAISVIVKKDYCSTFNNLNKPGYSKIIYEKRTKIAETLSRNSSIDIYGNFWSGTESNIKGEIWNKHAALDDYMFSVCMENTIQKNYISEKFWDSVIVGSIPIYLGCSNIYEYIEPNAFIYINGLSEEEISELLSKLIKDIKNEYLTRNKLLLNIKKNFFKDSKFNLWENVKNLIHEY